MIDRFRADERGAISVEYGMLVLVLALGIVVAIRALPTSLNAIWGSVASHLN